MKEDIKYIDIKSEIPIMGVDFLGVIDRGTNIIELKPLTLCNLRCKYCFVSSGDYNSNFIVNSHYLVEKVREIAKLKGNYDLEIHLAPYGEILLYKELFKLLNGLSEIEGVSTISMQSNGLLLSTKIIEKLKKNHLTRINISLNSLDEGTDCYLCNCTHFDVNKLLKNIYTLLDCNIHVLIAPVWFPGENEKDIEEIIELVLKLRGEGYSKQQIRIGIQKYLIYKTGRTLKKIDLKKDDLIKIKIVSRGRWMNECIGKINDTLGIKILLKKPIVFSEELIGKVIVAKIIKANYRDNILTALFPYN